MIRFNGLQRKINMRLFEYVLDWLFENSPTSFKVSARKICESFKQAKRMNPNLSNREICFIVLFNRYKFNHALSEEQVIEIVEKSDDFEEVVYSAVLLEIGEEKINKLNNNALATLSKMIYEEIQIHNLLNVKL